jgi:hypothetical protein
VFTGDFGASMEVQLSTIDYIMYSALLPSGGGGVATSIFGGGIIR